MRISYFSPQLKVSNEAKDATLDELASNGVAECVVEARHEIEVNTGLFTALKRTFRSALIESFEATKMTGYQQEMPLPPLDLDWTDCFRIGACMSYFAFKHNDSPAVPAVSLNTVKATAEQYSHVPAKVIYELMVECDQNLQTVLEAATADTNVIDAQQRLVSMGAGQVQFLLDNQLRADGLYSN
jgi:hypothetical protein